MNKREMINEIIEYEVASGTYKNINVRDEIEAMLPYANEKFIKHLYTDIMKKIRKEKLKNLNAL
jgi:hypothetical protein